MLPKKGIFCPNSTRRKKERTRAESKKEGKATYEKEKGTDYKILTEASSKREDQQRPMSSSDVMRVRYFESGKKISNNKRSSLEKEYMNP